MARRKPARRGSTARKVTKPKAHGAAAKSRLPTTVTVSKQRIAAASTVLQTLDLRLDAEEERLQKQLDRVRELKKQLSELNASVVKGAKTGKIELKRLSRS